MRRRQEDQEGGGNVGREGRAENGRREEGSRKKRRIVGAEQKSWS